MTLRVAADSEHGADHALGRRHRLPVDNLTPRRRTICTDLLFGIGRNSIELD